MTKKYTREDRYKAAALFIGTGNSEAVSRETGIPGSTIRHWAQHDEDFQLICQEYQAECGQKWRYKYAQIIDETIEQIFDRIRNGDFVRDTKTGELNRVPVKAKELTIIEAIHFDKLRLLESQPTAIVQRESSDEYLQRLAERFAAMSIAHRRGDVEEHERLTQGLGKLALPMPEQDKED